MIRTRPKVENIADFNELFAAREAAQPLMQEPHLGAAAARRGDHAAATRAAG